MAEKRKSTFQDCRCPHCRHPLDDLSTTAPACPQCNHALEPHEVWLTRRYPGLLVLPGWLKAFGWPLLLIIGGFGVIGLSYASGMPIPVELPVLLIGTGLVFVIVKLATNGDEV